MIPTYKALADGSIALQEDCEAMLEAFDAGTLTTPLVQAACNDWITTRKHWELSEAYLYGAAADYDIDPHIDSWPLDGTALQNLLNNNSMMAEIERNPDYVSANLGYGLLGFHALEYMLFENAGPAPSANTPVPSWYTWSVWPTICATCAYASKLRGRGWTMSPKRSRRSWRCRTGADFRLRRFDAQFGEGRQQVPQL